MDASSYQSSRLKARLLKVFPMLHIQTPSNVSKSQIVYSEDLTVGEVADNYVESPVLSNSQDGFEEENDDAVLFKVRNNILSPLYKIAVYMKQIIKNAPGIGTQWPPLSANLTLEAAFQSIPLELYNFIAWVAGYSSEATIERKVEIQDERKSKVLSLAQDLINISSAGRTQTQSFIPGHGSEAEYRISKAYTHFEWFWPLCFIINSDES